MSSRTNDFGELVLVVGDIHIPQRALTIPAQLMKMLVPNKMQHVLCTGNIGNKDIEQDLRSLAPNFHVVRGDFDDDSLGYPDNKVIQIGNFKIGLIHGHQIVPYDEVQSLALTQRRLGVDILVSGRSHRNGVNEFQGKWFVNPGSITGSYNATTLSDNLPSFVLLAIQGSKVITYLYELRGEQIDVSKSEFVKM